MADVSDPPARSKRTSSRRDPSRLIGRSSWILGSSPLVSETLGAKMLQQQVRGQGNIQESPVKSLSDREMEVFQSIGRWKKTREIAEELHLSVKTIEYYREQIKRKLNLKTGSELTHYATTWVQRENPA